MDKRAILDAMLKNIEGVHVYFQPPASVQMKYPAIRYERARVDNWHANNVPYVHAVGYELIVIDKDPDSKVVDYVSKLPMCRWNRHYTADNLNHDVFIIYPQEVNL